MCYVGGPRCSDRHKSKRERIDLNRKRVERLTKQINSAKNPDSPELDKYRSARARAALASGTKRVDKASENTFSGIHDPDGGATLSPNGEFTPSVGFCYSPYPERCKVYDSAQDFAPDEKTFVANLVKFSHENKDLIVKENHYVGLWNDPKTGKVYLDISVNTMNAAEARQQCADKDQLAYFDLQDYHSVEVDRNAKSGQQ